MEKNFTVNDNASKIPLTIKDKLGQGGFGQVFRAVDAEGNSFAVKSCTINSKNNKGIPNPLELSVMATLRHPHINRAISIRITDDCVYIIQDLAECDLSKLVRKNKKQSDVKFDKSKIREWLYALISAMSCLHNNKLIHADLKSSNILVYKNGTVKLSDFSVITKIIPGKKPFHLVGTATHRPLENHLRKEWDEKLDIWSLGCTIYEIIYGVLLFPSQSSFKDTHKEYNTDRFVNCLLDWGENGPVKQSINIVPTTLSFNKFNLVEDFKKDPCGINNLLLKMLSLKPENRPSINDIISHPYFSGISLSNSFLLVTEYKEISTKDANKILYEANSLKLMKEVIELSIDLYARTMALEGKMSRIRGCFLIAIKILRKDIPKDLKLDSRIFSMEKQICTYLQFRLHHRGEKH